MFCDALCQKPTSAILRRLFRYLEVNLASSRHKNTYTVHLINKDTAWSVSLILWKGHNLFSCHMEEHVSTRGRQTFRFSSSSSVSSVHLSTSPERRQQESCRIITACWGHRRRAAVFNNRVMSAQP